MKYNVSIELKRAIAVALGFTIFSFVSLDFSIGLFFCFIFIGALSHPNIVTVKTIFVTSVLLDIYANQFIGVLFLQYLSAYLFVARFRLVLLNSRIFFGGCYLCFIFCTSELICFALTPMLSGSFNIRYHFMRLIIVTLQCAGCLLIAFVIRKIRDIYAS